MAVHGGAPEVLREKDHEIAWKGPGRGRTSWKELREVQDESTNHKEKFLCEQDGQAGNHLHPKMLSTARSVLQRSRHVCP